ncbi:TfuA domain-containing protein [Streptomyces sp. NBC_00193]|uniref:TfuA domain-containing protein n=1 Tax=Streptomyces sp. NBC_00193 TaxID=2975675 RepID=UPI0022512863|nr:TfuA domain-containing protein [Streptomyces sp. NBC_00193]MCX5301298.1 TfuA domain-containing protein [Streptomyces sp. NBC_00193]
MNERSMGGSGVNGSRVIVYAGPTLSAADVHAVLPEAQVRPPAGRGDLLADQWHPGDVVVVVDGYFRERRSVGHKEILQVLTEGAEVIGAASMGALRAAELAPCGMRGLGTVFTMYASGEIDGDDEVGVLHGPAEMGYPAQTVALVNLRYGCKEGAETELIAPDAGRRIVAAAAALPFTHRGWKDIERALDEEDHESLGTLEEMIASGVWDLKRLDAMAALRAIASRGAVTPGPVAPEVPFTGISRTQSLVRRTRREYAPGRWMSDLDVLDAARLFDEGYPALHEDVLTGLLEELAGARGMTLEGYARAKIGLDGRSQLPDSLARWFTEEERDGLPVADLIRLLMVRVWPVWQSVDWRPAVLARLRESEHWEEWCALVVRADEAAEETRPRLVVPPPPMCAKLFLRHWQGRGTSPDVEMARRGFSGPDGLGGAVTRFFALDVLRGRERRNAGVR